MQLATPDVLLRQNGAFPFGPCAPANCGNATRAATTIDEPIRLRISLPLGDGCSPSGRNDRTARMVPCEPNPAKSPVVATLYRWEPARIRRPCACLHTALMLRSARPFGTKGAQGRYRGGATPGL